MYSVTAFNSAFISSSTLVAAWVHGGSPWRSSHFGRKSLMHARVYSSCTTLLLCISCGVVNGMHVGCSSRSFCTNLWPPSTEQLNGQGICPPSAIYIIYNYLIIPVPGINS